MINQLRQIYSSLLIHDEGCTDSDYDYKWFVTGEDVIIGILEKELTTKDVALLTTFLTPYNIKFPLPTKEEKKWRKLIFSAESTNSDYELVTPYRFVYFSLENNQVDAGLFKDALHDLFAKAVPIIWLTGNEGIIIDETTAYDESISFEQIIDVLMSDLDMKIKLFIGPYKSILEQISQHYQTIVSDAKIVFSTTDKSVVTYMNAVSYLLLDQSEPDLRARIGQSILQEYIHDDETLKMIEVLLQCNLNISEASKVLHMHRNSLQYRLDRFYEKTGADIRLFHHAHTVYLALLAIK